MRVRAGSSRGGWRVLGLCRCAWIGLNQLPRWEDPGSPLSRRPGMQIVGVCWSWQVWVMAFVLVERPAGATCYPEHDVPTVLMDGRAGKWEMPGDHCSVGHEFCRRRVIGMIGRAYY